MPLPPLPLFITLPLIDFAAKRFRPAARRHATPFFAADVAIFAYRPH